MASSPAPQLNKQSRASVVPSTPQQPRKRRRTSTISSTPQPSKRHRASVLSTPQSSLKQPREIADSTASPEPLSLLEYSSPKYFTLFTSKQRIYPSEKQLWGQDAQPRNPLLSQSSIDLSTQYSDEEKAARDKIQVLKRENLELKKMIASLQELVVELCNKTGIVGGPAYWKVAMESI